MSEEEIIDIIKPFQTNYEELDGAKDIKISIEEYQAILGLLDLYNKEKEKNKKLVNPNKLQFSYYDVNGKTRVCLNGFVSKDKIRQEIKELENMNVDGEVFTTALNFAKKELENLLEE